MMMIINISHLSMQKTRRMAIAILLLLLLLMLPFGNKLISKSVIHGSGKYVCSLLIAHTHAFVQTFTTATCSSKTEEYEKKIEKKKKPSAAAVKCNGEKK